MSRLERRPNVVTIAASLPFAETLTRKLIADLGAERDPLALSRARIYLPTRRAARNFAEVFARLLGGAALLPEFKPLGEVDEDELVFEHDLDDLDLAPAISPIRRKLLLATLVKRWDEARRHGTIGFAQASALADGLGRLMDEADAQGVDLSRLPDLAPHSLATHWQDVTRFLALLNEQWPELLLKERRINPAERRDRLLRALAKRLADRPPEGRVIAAGSTGSIPATAELLGVIARLPEGMVVLPGLDRSLDEEAWSNLDPGHPQYGMKQLLERMDVARADVEDLGDGPRCHAREKLLRETLRPAPTTDAWRALADSDDGGVAEGLGGLSLIEASDPPEEAGVIALALREALESEGATAALVTPDRSLARRVAAEMGRWNIEIDDSGGQPLAHAPAGAFLCLLAEAADSGFAPAPLLALLKHPLASMGRDAALFREHARALDIRLRGPRPDAGLDGVQRKLERAPAALRDWFAQVAVVLRPLGETLAARETEISAAARVHLEAAEALCPPSELWRGEAGEKAARLFDELAVAATDIPKIEKGAYAPLFRSLARAIPIRPVYGRHPRLSILGPLEARLLRFDLVILGGLNEGTWPRAAAADPWFSRPMRKALGLESPEFRIGQSAHDFATLAAGPRVLMTRATKVDGAPTIASRWVQRLVQLARGLGLHERLAAGQTYAAIRAALEEPAAVRPERRPAPRPPVAARPRELSVTEIETWLRDPYAIYAKRVLKLRPLDPLDAEIGPLERGSAAHKALERFIQEFPGDIPEGAELRLIAIADTIFRDLGAPKAALAVWRPRFINAARWFVAVERERRARVLRSHLERKGERRFDGPAGAFRLYGVADRIDELSGGGAAVVDYKTGAPPSDKQVKQLLAPQLPLEAAILESGGFAGIPAIRAAELVYIRFSGGATPGELRTVKADAASLSAEAARKLSDRIAFFDDPSTPYLSRLKPYRADTPGDYDHLARVREWSLAGWEEQEE
ncbi:MAG TPA: double-strand break repair protein AddB [Rhizomicrobium sp.]|nr:double-strand break repair protein AddB [Rhizomicrobium sp.]